MPPDVRESWLKHVPTVQRRPERTGQPRVNPLSKSLSRKQERDLQREVRPVPTSCIAMVVSATQTERYHRHTFPCALPGGRCDSALMSLAKVLPTSFDR